MNVRKGKKASHAEKVLCIYTKDNTLKTRLETFAKRIPNSNPSLVASEILTKALDALEKLDVQTTRVHLLEATVTL